MVTGSIVPIRSTLALALLASVGCEQRLVPKDPLAIVHGETASPSASLHPERLRVVQWNIKSGRDSSIEAIATRLSALDADIIVLQEVDSETRRGAGIDQTSFLGRMLERNYVFAPTIPWDGGIYGIATLSRFPFVSVQRIALSNELAEEPRTALDTWLRIQNTDLRIVNHHADIVLPAAVQSTREVLEDIRASNGIVFAGDFNQVPSDEGPQACVEAGLVDLGHEHADTPTDGVRRIDYVFADRALARCVQAMTVEQTSESDHNALVVDFDPACLLSE